MPTDRPLGMTTYTVDLDIENRWLVATDQDGASRIIARDVDLGLAWLVLPDGPNEEPQPDAQRLQAIRDAVDCARPGDVQALWSFEADFRWLLSLAESAAQREVDHAD